MWHVTFVSFNGLKCSISKKTSCYGIERELKYFCVPTIMHKICNHTLVKAS